MTALHLLGGVPIPGVVVLLTVFLSPQPADFTVFLEVLGPLLQTLLGHGFPEQKKAEYARVCFQSSSTYKVS